MQVIIPTDWDLYWNLEGTEQVRANLVYTPYISPDKQTLCMSFNRDVRYHKHEHENALWTEELLTDRFKKEIAFHTVASMFMPTLKLCDVVPERREIYFEWHGDDFLMQGTDVLPDWQEQWIDRIETMWANDIYKISLHPNSWTAHNGELIPFNWFFCYHENDAPVTLRSLLIQISSGRQEKLNGINLDKEYAPKELQQVAFNSFRHNYPKELIDNVIQRSTIHRHT